MQARARCCRARGAAVIRQSEADTDADAPLGDCSQCRSLGPAAAGPRPCSGLAAGARVVAACSYAKVWHKVWRSILIFRLSNWSEWQDLNLRPPRPERGKLPQNPAFSCNPTTSRPLSRRARVLVVDQATRPFPSLFHRSAYCTAAKVSIVGNLRRLSQSNANGAAERVTDAGEAPTAASSELLRVAFNRGSISLL